MMSFGYQNSSSSYFSSSSYSIAPFLPLSKPAPLSLRSPNCMSPPRSESSSSSSKPQPFSRRPVKATPFHDSARNVQTRRASAQKEQARERREDRRWDARGEQILHSQWFSDKQRWQSDLSHDAPPVTQEMPDEEEELPAWLSEAPHYNENVPQHSTMGADDVPYWEDAELEAYSAMFSTQQQQPADDTEPRSEASTHFGSDDEDMDGLFDDWLQQSTDTPENAANAADHPDLTRHDEMDTSGG